MRCENCPALRNVGGYEYPEYGCVVQDEDNIRSFADGSDGCLLHLKTILKRIEKHEEMLSHAYDGIGEWYVLTHEIEEDPKMLDLCVSVMKHAIGLSGPCAHWRGIYHRHGKAFYKPWRNYYATTRGTAAYPAWKKLHFIGFATCSSLDDTPYWEKQDMTEMLYYTVTQKGFEWLEKHVDGNEPIYIRREK